MGTTLDSLSYLPLSKKIFLGAGIVLFIAFIYLYLIYLPLSTELKQKEYRLNRLKVELNQQKALAENLSKVKEEVANLDKELSLVLAQLPDREEIPRLLQDISRLGKEAGLEFLFFKPGIEVPRGFYAEIPVELKISGGYHQIASFFDRLRRLPRIITVSKLNMGEAEEVGNRMRIITSCFVTTFRFLEKEQVVEKKK